MAVQEKLKNFKEGKGLKHPLYDARCFPEVREYFGGNLRTLIVSSAPISGDVVTFSK